MKFSLLAEIAMEILDNFTIDRINCFITRSFSSQVKVQISKCYIGSLAAYSTCRLLVVVIYFMILFVGFQVILRIKFLSTEKLFFLLEMNLFESERKKIVENNDIDGQKKLKVSSYDLPPILSTNK
jgi:hypothetical protein